MRYTGLRLRGLLLVLAILANGCGSQVDPNDIDDIETLMAEYGVPGVSIAIVRDGQIRLETYGVTNADTKAPVTTSTLFQAASLSKMVTAVAALKYVQEGDLELDNAINISLTSWQIPSNGFTAQQEVTLRHLLSHTAGTTVSGFRGYAAGEAVPTLVQVLDGAPPANSDPIVVNKTPGGSFRYSGGGYSIIQQSLIDISGRSFPDLMSETVLAPLGMSGSTFEQPLPAAHIPEASAGHRSNGNVVDGVFHTYPEMAAAALWTTPEDLAKFAIELQRTLAGQSNVVLTQDMAVLMMTPVTSGYALGVVPLSPGGEAYFSHNGHNEGFESFLVAHMTAGVGGVIMMNSEGNPVLERLVQIIAEREGWPGF